MTPAADLTRESIAAVDVAAQLADILGLPEQLRDALWRVESANLEPHESPGGLVVAGMGGSAIGGALARAALGDRASRPIVLARGYALPAWTTPDTTVLCSSYSGDTEETLAVFEAAGALGARRIVVDHRRQARRGGARRRRPGDPAAGRLPAPRRGRLLAGRRARGRGDLRRRRAPARRDRRRRRRTPRRSSPPGGPTARRTASPKALARGLHGTVPQIAGAGLTAPIAYRWKTQINENAKMPAFSGELPELDHNEIAGWDGAEELGPFSAVFLDDSDLHPRIRQRIELTRGLIAGRGMATYRRRQRSARRGWSGWSRWCCSATSCRCTSRCCAGSTRAAVDGDRAAQARARPAARGGAQCATWGLTAVVAGRRSSSSIPRCS